MARAPRKPVREDNGRRRAQFLRKTRQSHSYTAETRRPRRSRDLRQQTVEDLIRMATDFTRKRSALVFGLASLAGFLAFRVIKSSPPGKFDGVPEE
jgi:hypothetical protein